MSFKKFVYYTLPVFLLSFGLLILFSGSLVIKLGVPSTAYLLSIFFIYNIVVSKLVGYWDILKKSWSVGKIRYLPIGFLFGLAPVGVAIFLSFVDNSDVVPILWQNLSVSSLFGTFLIVSWEELWFRGIALEIAGKRYGEIKAASIFGLIFCLLHIFNPQINLVHHAMELFLAGYTLSIAYFLSKSIWLPLGMHFANNLMGLFLNENSNSNPIEQHLFAYTLTLGVIALLFTKRCQVEFGKKTV